MSLLNGVRMSVKDISCGKVNALKNCLFFSKQKTIVTPDKRVSNPDFDGSSSSVVVGVSELGLPYTQPCSYNVKTLDISNTRMDAEAFRKDYSKSGIVKDYVIGSSACRLGETMLKIVIFFF